MSYWTKSIRYAHDLGTARVPPLIVIDLKLLLTFKPLYDASASQELDSAFAQWKACLASRSPVEPKRRLLSLIKATTNIHLLAALEDHLLPSLFNLVSKRHGGLCRQILYRPSEDHHSSLRPRSTQ